MACVGVCASFVACRVHGCNNYTLICVLRGTRASCGSMALPTDTVIYHDRNSYTGPGGCSGVVIVVVGAGEERDSRCPPKPGGLICLWLRSRPWGRVGPVTGPVGHHVPSLFVRSGKVGVLVTTLSLLTYSTHPPPLVWSSSINHQTDWPMRPSAGPP